jgi:hypothetical protein
VEIGQRRWRWRWDWVVEYRVSTQNPATYQACPLLPSKTHHDRLPGSTDPHIPHSHLPTHGTTLHGPTASPNTPTPHPHPPCIETTCTTQKPNQSHDHDSFRATTHTVPNGSPQYMPPALRNDYKTSRGPGLPNPSHSEGWRDLPPHKDPLAWSLKCSDSPN